MGLQISQARSDLPSSRRCGTPVPACPSEPFFIGNIVEVFIFFAHFVWVSKRHTEELLATRFKREHVLARGEDDSAERYHAFLADRLANDSKRLLAHEVLRTAWVEFVDFFLRHELVDFDRALALNGDCFEFLRIDLNVRAFADFVPFNDLLAIDFITGLCIDFAILDPVSGATNLAKTLGGAAVSADLSAP